MRWDEFSENFAASGIGKTISGSIAGKAYRRIRRYRLDFIMKLRRSEVAKNGLRDMHEIFNALKSEGLICFADCGTLRCIIRDGNGLKGKDLDFGILQPDQTTWKKLEQAMNKTGYRLKHQFRLQGSVMEQTYKKGLMSVDFFGHWNIGDKSVFYYFWRIWGNTYPSHDCFDAYEMPNIRLDEAEEIVYQDNKTVCVPNDVEKYLDGIYTEKWRTQAASDRLWRGGRHISGHYGYIEKN